MQYYVMCGGSLGIQMDEEDHPITGLNFKSIECVKLNRRQCLRCVYIKLLYLTIDDALELTHHCSPIHPIRWFLLLAGGCDLSAL